MLGLNEKSDPRAPLLADGFAPGGTSYSTHPQVPGGVWKGKKAIVVRADASGAVERLDSNTRTVPRSDAAPRDLFQPDTTSAPPWLENCAVLQPLAP